MDKKEAREILTENLSRYKKHPYGHLLRLLNEPNMSEVTASSGARYQLEFLAVWDDKQNGNLRVIGSIDDGGIRAFSPLSEDFIITPDGEFIGE